MGFYDHRCMVSGVSLKGARAVLVLLVPVGSAHRPVTLGVHGSYNRYGSIDVIRDDDNTDLVLSSFLDWRRDGRFVLDTDYYGHYRFHPVTTVEQLFRCVERNLTDRRVDDPAATLDARRLVFALVAQQVWAALAATVQPGTGSASEWADQLFRDSPAGHEIYRGWLPEVADQLRQTYAVDRHLADRGRSWAPPGPPDQHYGEEMRAFLADARREFAAEPRILAALDAYADEVDELLVDD